MILYMTGLRASTFGIMLLAVALRGTERRVVRGLESKAATAPDRAVALLGLGPLGRLILRRLVAVGAVKAMAEEKYYLEREDYTLFRRRRRMRALVILGVLLVVIGVMWWRGAG
jgi:hypothetical protein